MSQREMDGRVALVTGASGALGRTIRDEFENRRARVVPVDVAGEDCELFDVATTSGCEGMVSRALELHGRLDMLILNAGVQHVAPIEEFPEAEWDRVMGVCLKGPFLAIRAAWPALTARPGGRIIVTASTSSFVEIGRASCRERV